VKLRKTPGVPLLILAVLLTAKPVSAAAINMTSPGLEYGSGLFTLGFEFTVDEALEVTSLGYYDSGEDGLPNPAEVAVWLATGGAPLVSAVVPGGTGGELESFFRYVDIAPLLLNPGTNYVIGGFLRDGTASSLFTGQFGTGTIDPRVDIVLDRYSPFDSAFGFPTSTDSTQGAWLGANFRTEPSEVPEPGTLILLGGGLATLAARRRRRSSSQKIAS
jgi:hypothetical protein